MGKWHPELSGKLIQTISTSFLLGLDAVILLKHVTMFLVNVFTCVRWGRHQSQSMACFYSLPCVQLCVSLTRAFAFHVIGMTKLDSRKEEKMLNFRVRKELTN